MLFDKFDIIPKNASYDRIGISAVCTYAVACLEIFLWFSVSTCEYLLCLVLYLFRVKKLFVFSLCIGLQKMGDWSS